MNKKILTAALLGGLAFAQAASAQEFDDRWYLTGSAGFNFQDSDRTTNDAPFVTLGLGKFMHQVKAIKQAPTAVGDYFFDDPLIAGGS